MIGEVFIELDSTMSDIMLQIVPEWRKFLYGGKLYLLLKKALYGCIESAKLFYDHISGSLKNIGFKANGYDQCVFNKIMYGKQCTITIHVDDLLICCEDQRGIDDVLRELTRVYSKVNAITDLNLDYLGMEFEFSRKGVVKVSMAKMVKTIIKEWGSGLKPIDSSAKTPAVNSLFEISQSSQVLDSVKREKFHSNVAKLLYLAKRGRPDILLAVNFLTTRVSCSTADDWQKLDRVMKYLHGTLNLYVYLVLKDY
jgi:hypothetical protein